MKQSHLLIFVIAIVLQCSNGTAMAGPKTEPRTDGSAGPLDRWPDFVPIGFITAPHPDNPNQQTYLYGDWGGIVGEEFIFLQDDLIKLLYHSYHETYMTHHPYEQEILHDWALGYDAKTKIKFTPLVRPGGPIPGPAWDHTDTPGYIQHPITGEHLLYNTVRPGTKDLRPEWKGLPGSESAIQVATSETPPAIGVPFFQTYENALVAELWWELGWVNNGVVTGGLSEPTPVWVPHLGEQGMIRLFYRGLHGAQGSFWNWRISYADSEDGKTGWIKHEIPTFDPSVPGNPAYQWTLPPPKGYSFRGAWQAHCTGDVRAGGVHMVLCVSNQNYASGGALAYYWSPDWGDTWFGHPDNPIIVPGESADGVPASGFQRTPTLTIDETYHRYILAYNAAFDASIPWQRRTYLAVADRPPEDLTGVEPEPGRTLRLGIESVAPNPGQGASHIEVVLPVPGLLQVNVYGIDGRLVTRIVNEEFTAGRHTLTWNHAAATGLPVPSGVYFLLGSLQAGGRTVAEARGRIVVLK